MSDALRSIVEIPPPFNMVVLIVLIITAGSAISAGVGQMRRYFTHRQELEFKRELLDRGMSAEEIERVVRAQSAAVSEASGCGVES